MQVFGLKNCDTTRKALKMLVEPEFFDVRVDGVPEKVLLAAFDLFGQALINTRSTTWRGLSEDDRAQPPLALLAANPTLMKRPLIVDGDRMTLGWSAAVQSEWGA